jgi:hypothetical protein
MVQLTGNQILIIGLSLTVIIGTCGFMKLLRSNKTLFILSIITAVIGIYGILIRGVQTELVNGNGADFLIAPFTYITTYAFLRMLYKKIYKVEPTYARYSWYDAEEGRKQNWFDVSVYILPMMLSFVVPIIIGNLI